MPCGCQGSSYASPDVQAQRSAARSERRTRERRATNITDPSYFAHGAPKWNGPQPKKVAQPAEVE